MVSEKVLIEFVAKDAGFHQSITRVNKAIQKLQRPLSATDAIARTTFTNMNSQIKDFGNSFAKIMPKLQDNFKKVSLAGSGMRNVFAMSMSTWKEVNQKGFQEGFTRAGKFANRIRFLTHGMRGFRMEMLSVMFFGMGMQRMFKGLIMPAMQMVGVFDVFKTALQILFLPLALKVLDWALRFLDWVTTMSPHLQKLINGIVVIGYALGTFLAVLGAVTLGAGGLILVFGGIIASIFSMIPGWGKLVSAMGFFVAAPALFGKLGGAMDWVKEKVSEILDVFVGMDFVQDILDELGI